MGKNNFDDSKNRETKEYLYYLVANNKALYNFFTKFNEYGEKIDNEDIQKIISKLDETGDKYIKKEKEYLLLKDKLITSGITLSNKSKTDVYRVVAPAKNLGIADISKYDSAYINFPNLFNSIEITKKMLENDSKEYLEDYLSWNEKHKDINEKIEHIEKELKTKELKLKKVLFGKQTLIKEINNLKSDLKYWQEELKRGEILKEKKETYEELIKNNKELIVKYINSVEICKLLSKEIKGIINEYNNVALKFNIKRTRSSKWERAFKNLILEENSCEEINNIVMKSINESKSKNVSKEINDFKNNNLSNEICGAIDWYYDNFLKNELKEDKTNIKKR